MQAGEERSLRLQRAAIRQQSRKDVHCQTLARLDGPQVSQRPAQTGMTPQRMRWCLATTCRVTMATWSLGASRTLDQIPRHSHPLRTAPSVQRPAAQVQRNKPVQETTSPGGSTRVVHTHARAHTHTHTQLVLRPRTPGNCRQKSKVDTTKITPYIKGPRSSSRRSPVRDILFTVAATTENQAPHTKHGEGEAPGRKQVRLRKQQDHACIHSPGSRIQPSPTAANCAVTSAGTNAAHFAAPGLDENRGQQSTNTGPTAASCRQLQKPTKTHS